MTRKYKFRQNTLHIEFIPDNKSRNKIKVKEELLFLSKFKNRIIVVISFFVIILSLVLVPLDDNTAQASVVHKGVALKSPTNVYGDANSGSNVLKSYSKGSILLYRSHSANWYTTNVTVNGKRHTGYINKADVDTSVENQQLVQGIGLLESTAVYASASTDSKKLKTYPVGSLLYYNTFSSEWYETSVIINGKRVGGYIHKSHVENGIESPEILKGLAILNPTAVYSRASTSSPTLKSYSGGTILQYRDYTSQWYKATVYIGGKAKTGFIHKDHIDETVENQISLRGIGLKNRTAVYAHPTAGAAALKTYAEGSILQYKTLSSNWYETSVILQGKRVKGYIQTSHVEGTFDTSQSLDGMSLKSPTHVYSRASKNASVLKSYSKDRYLLFKTFSPNWYEATVVLNGKRTTGYIHRNDISTDKVSIKTTSYSTNFNRVIDIQMGGSPQVSGPNGGWLDASRQQVEYYANSSNFNKNSTDFYQFLVLSQHASLNANEVNQKILNNHGILTGKAQAFIDAGRKHSVNEAYLISHALLETGNGKSDLANGIPVDDKGNVVPANRAVHTVYNMYGIGAVDSNPIGGGAKRAFNEGWFTPEDAIIGGAQFINTYITRGQDTLYKMRWNPSSPGYPQYATDVAWATKQTSNISRIYSLLDRYVLIYDVPRYVNQPSSSGNPKIFKNNTRATMSMFSILLETPTEQDEINANIEIPEKTEVGEMVEIPEPDEVVESIEESESVETPETDEEAGEAEETTEENEIIEFEEEQVYGLSTDEVELVETSNVLESTVYATIPEGTKLEILAIDGTWYEVTYEGQVGWINGEHITLLNLLEVTVDNVNIQKEANDLSSTINIVLSEMILVAVLDEEDAIVRENEWIQILYNGEEAWINGNQNGTETLIVK